jgi:hypothetical protein
LLHISLDHLLFTEDPYAAFSSRFGCDQKAWREAYHNRYLWYGYEVDMVQEWLKLKHKVDIKERALRKWIFRTEVFLKAQRARERGATAVTEEFFGDKLTGVLSFKGIRRWENGCEPGLTPDVATLDSTTS